MAISVTRRSDLSLLYRILRTLIKPLRPHLAAPKAKHAAGSPRLKKHPRRVGKVKITEREVLVLSTVEVSLHFLDSQTTKLTESIWVYDFHAPAPTAAHDHPSDDDAPPRQPTQTIYYFAGGGFQAPPSSEHWKFCAHLASALAPAGHRVVLVSSPLAPRSPARDALPLLRRWLAHALSADLDTDVVALAGDSSGANVALSLALWCAEQHSSSPARLRAVLALSPPADLRNTNPAIARADAADPVLGTRVAEGAARAWAAGSDPADPHLSPALADTAALRAAGIAVSGAVGTADVLAPDALKFMEGCEGAGVEGDWLVWEGQMHCFPLTACYGLREGREGREWVVETLMRQVEG
ncbi:Alpha/Beta hydrolase protein [Hypoxylon sp. FL1284]|nr:Alpha/Beta hydrolase protein [Hypoxylon sp. FL1284]